MFKSLMHRGTTAFERQWNYDAAYVHDLIDADPRAAPARERRQDRHRWRRESGGGSQRD